MRRRGERRHGARSARGRWQSRAGALVALVAALTLGSSRADVPIQAGTRLATGWATVNTLAATFSGRVVTGPTTLRIYGTLTYARGTGWRLAADAGDLAHVSLTGVGENVTVPLDPNRAIRLQFRRLDEAAAVRDTLVAALDDLGPPSLSLAPGPGGIVVGGDAAALSIRLLEGLERKSPELGTAAREVRAALTPERVERLKGRVEVTLALPALLPSRVVYTQEAGDTRVDLAVTDVKVNEPLSAEALPAPPTRPQVIEVPVDLAAMRQALREWSPEPRAAPR